MKKHRPAGGVGRAMSLLFEVDPEDGQTAHSRRVKLLSGVEVDLLLEALVLLLGGLFGVGEEHFGTLGECAGNLSVTNFAADEVLIASGGILAVEGEGVLAGCSFRLPLRFEIISVRVFFALPQRELRTRRECR